MVPSESALLRRPGREEEEVLRGDLKSCWFVSWRILGGVGTKRDVAEEGKPVPVPLENRVIESPERYLRGRYLRWPVDFRVATAAVKPTKQHRDVVPNLAVSSQLGVSVFRYLSAKCRPITMNHKTEANASILRSLIRPAKNIAKRQVNNPRTATAI